MRRVLCFLGDPDQSSDSWLQVCLVMTLSAKEYLVYRKASVIGDDLEEVIFNLQKV